MFRVADRGPGRDDFPGLIVLFGDLFIELAAVAVLFPDDGFLFFCRCNERQKPVGVFADDSTGFEIRNDLFPGFVALDHGFAGVVDFSLFLFRRCFLRIKSGALFRVEISVQLLVHFEIHVQSNMHRFHLHRFYIDRVGKASGHHRRGKHGPCCKQISVHWRPPESFFMLLMMLSMFARERLKFTSRRTPAKFVRVLIRTSCPPT